MWCIYVFQFHPRDPKHLYHIILQQKGTFETGQEDSTEVPEELKLRLAYREAAVAVLACYFPDPHRPFTEVVKYSIFFALQRCTCLFWGYLHFGPNSIRFCTHNSLNLECTSVPSMFVICAPPTLFHYFLPKMYFSIKQSCTSKLILFTRKNIWRMWVLHLLYFQVSCGFIWYME